jgi:fatty acid desaturase
MYEYILGFLSFLIFIFIAFVSTLLHEISHLRKIKKYNLKYFKSKKDYIKSNSKNSIPKFSFFLFCINVTYFGFGGVVYLKDGEIEKLKLRQQEEVMMAGIKTDIIFAMLLVIIYYLINLLFTNLSSVVNIDLNIIFLLSIGVILAKIYDNIFDTMKMGSDFKKLLKLKKRF